MDANIPAYIPISATDVVYITSCVYKFFKSRKGNNYEQQLNQAVMSGARNVYNLIALHVEFFGSFIMLTVHLLFVNRLDEDLQATSGPAIILAFILLCIILIHFLWNHKRR